MSSTEPLDRIFSVRGLNLAALTWDQPRPQVPPILLLHGWQDQAGTWYRVAPHLPGYRVALDLRGFGKSDHNPAACAYAFSEYLVDVDQVITQLLQETQSPQVLLIGHSMGGTIASIYAGLYPDRVAGCALIDGLGIADGLGGAVDRLRQHIEGHRQPPTSRPLQSRAAAAARLRQLYPRLDPAQAQFMADRAVRPLAEPGLWCWRADPRHRTRLAVPYRRDQHEKILAEIQTPVLSVHPSQPVFDAHDVAALEARISNLQRVVIPDSGHMIPLDAPDALGGVLQAFARQQGVG